MSFADLTQKIVDLVNGSVVPLIYALAFLLFLVGIVRYFFLGASEENRDKGKQFMIWGVVGFVVMFSVWGLVNFLISILPSGV